MKDTILLLESGKENYRAFTFDAMTREGAKIVLVSKDVPTWQKRYIADSIIADPETPRFIEQVTQVCERRPLAGVTTFVERLVPLAAEIAQRLKVPGVSIESAEAARNKLTMRRRFAQAGLWTPKQCLLQDAMVAPPADFRLPAVVKPVMGFASLNVMRIDDWSELTWVASVIMKENHPTLPDPGAAYLVEEYIDGPEFSVESCVGGDTIVHYAVTEKILSPEPYFEEIAHISPANVDSEVCESLFATAERAIRSLDLDHCVTHTEIRLSPHRGPVVIEVAARLGGDKIPYLVERSTYVSPSLALARTMLGQTIPTTGKAQEHAGIVFFVPRQANVVTASLQDEPSVEGLLEFECSAKEGQSVQVPPEQFFTRLGYAVVTGGTNREIRHRIDAVVKSVELKIGVPLHGVMS